MKPGTRYFSAVSDTAVVVVRPPSADTAVLACGGVPMATEAPATPGTPAADLQEPTLLGKRYVDADSGLELLVSKGGIGTLTLDGRALELKAAKPLPASD